MRGPGSPALGGRDWVAAALLFVVVALLYHRAPVHQVYDWRYSTAVSHSFLHDGRLAVDPRFEELLDRRFFIEVGGQIYHWYPNAPAVLNVPALFLFERLGVSVFDDEGGFRRDAEYRVLRFSAAVVAATVVAISFLTARHLLGMGWSLAVSLVLAFGTSMFSTASRPYWSHTWAVFFLAVALYGFVAPAGRHERLRWGLVATAVAWAVFCRPNMFLSALALTLALAARRRRGPLAVFVAVGGLWLAAFCVHSLATYDQVLPPYFFSSHVETDRISIGRMLGFHPEGAAGTLFSPARGLLTFTPILVPVLVGVAWRWRRLASRSLAAAGLGAIAAQWHLVSSVENWEGGAGFGPRLLTDVLPWFFVLGVMALAAGRAPEPTPARPGPRWLARAMLALLALLSVGIHARGALDHDTRKHWGLWNWSYPQFVAGLYPVPGVPLPGALLEYEAARGVAPGPRWRNQTRRAGFDLALHESVVLGEAAGTATIIDSALRFVGGGGGTTRPLAELGAWATRGDLSVEIWVRPREPAAGKQVLFETGGRDTGWTVYLDGGEPRFELRSGGRASSKVAAAPGRVSFEEFTQIVATIEMEAEGARLRLWVDGEPAAGPVTAPGVVRWAGGNASGLATDDNLPSAPAGDFVGEIAVLRFYRVALGPSRVAHNYRAVARRR